MLIYRLKIRCAVFAKRADIICRQFIAFVNISADFTNKTFFAFCFRLWFDVVLIVGICHGFGRRNNP